MSDTGNQSELEAARARLEAALSTLTQGVASARDALDMAATIAEEKTALTDRIAALEQENLKLHEQVATLALQPEPDPSSDNARIIELEEQNSAIQNNYQTLKEQYVALQDKLEANSGSPAGANDNTAVAENNRLKLMIAEMEQEKSAIKGELDKTISELESMLEDA